jgi:hypothetical protein
MFLVRLLSVVPGLGVVCRHGRHAALSRSWMPLLCVCLVGCVGYFFLGGVITGDSVRGLSSEAKLEASLFLFFCFLVRSIRFRLLYS